MGSGLDCSPSQKQKETALMGWSPQPTRTQVPQVFENALAVPASNVVVRKELQYIGDRQVFQAAITGTITYLDVPEVKAGAYIDINITYNAYNPNGSFWNWWKIFVVAKDSLGNKEEVKAATVTSDRFSDSGSWRLWKMPGQPITLEIRLYGHDEVLPWDWSWWP